MKLPDRLGIVAFWLGWPGLWLYLHWSHRTRALIVCKDTVLVTKSWLGSGKWSLPGGGLHPGEPALEGLLREVREETSLNLSPEQVRPLLHERYRDKGLSFDCQYFVAEVPEQAVVVPQPGEIVAVAWVERQTLSASNAGEDVRRALAAWPTKA